MVFDLVDSTNQITSLIRSLHLIWEVRPPEFRSVRSPISTGALVQFSKRCLGWDKPFPLFPDSKHKTKTIRQGKMSTQMLPLWSLESWWVLFPFATANFLSSTRLDLEPLCKYNSGGNWGCSQKGLTEEGRAPKCECSIPVGWSPRLNKKGRVNWAAVFLFPVSRSNMTRCVRFLLPCLPYHNGWCPFWNDKRKQTLSPPSCFLSCCSQQ